MLKAKDRKKAIQKRYKRKKKRVVKKKNAKRDKKKSICRYLICIMYNIIKESIKKKLIIQKKS